VTPPSKTLLRNYSQTVANQPTLSRGLRISRNAVQDRGRGFPDEQVHSGDQLNSFTGLQMASRGNICKREGAHISSPTPSPLDGKAEAKSFLWGKRRRNEIGIRLSPLAEVCANSLGEWERIKLWVRYGRDPLWGAPPQLAWTRLSSEVTWMREILALRTHTGTIVSPDRLQTPFTPFQNKTFNINSQTHINLTSYIT
jgi:hypothetical protein